MQQTAQRRSLLPRLVYLSIQCVSASVKDNIEANGSLSDSKFLSEMKSLLERYAEIFGFSLNDALKVLLDVTDGKSSLEVCPAHPNSFSVIHLVISLLILFVLCVLAVPFMNRHSACVNFFTQYVLPILLTAHFIWLMNLVR